MLVATIDELGGLLLRYDVVRLASGCWAIRASLDGTAVTTPAVSEDCEGARKWAQKLFSARVTPCAVAQVIDDLWETPVAPAGL
jgi:hypothetical protein